jgi:hypothetical protein
VDNKKAVTTTSQEKERLVLKTRPCQDGNKDDFERECFSSEQVVDITVTNGL